MEAKRTIPLFKVFMSSDAKATVAGVLDSGYIGQGSTVTDFESALKALFGCDLPPLTVNSCTSGIDLCLALCGITDHSEVISTPVTCVATNSHLFLRNATIKWADVHPISGLIDPEDVARTVTKNTALIIAVDYGGNPCDYTRLRALGIPVLEDAAHALLTTFDNAHISNTGGDYVCWSFQAIKHLTCGDGGAVKVPIHQYDRAKLLRWYGYNRDLSESFRCSQDLKEMGYKYHMNNINAAIGLSNAQHAQALIARQREIAKYFCASISNCKVTVPHWDPRSSYWLFTLIADDRASLQSFLESHGIQSSQVHARNDSYTALQSFAINLPGVNAFASRNLSIPVGWWLTDTDVQFIVDAVSSWR